MKVTKWVLNTWKKIPWALVCASILVTIIYFNLAEQATGKLVEIGQEVSPGFNGSTSSRKNLVKAANEFLNSKKITTDSIISPQTALNNYSVQKLQDSIAYEEEIRKREVRSLPWILLFVSIGVFFILAFLYIKTLKTEREEQIVRDRDPDELRLLFERYASQITSLGTPRKVKRFSNRIRFQYNLLKLSGIINDMESADYFFRIVIQAEKGRECYLLPYEEFASKFPFRTQSSEDEIVLAKIFEYNFNILV